MDLERQFADPTPEDSAHPFIGDALAAYRFPLVLIPALLFALSVWGILDGMRDADGDRFLGLIPFAAPSVMAIWWAIAGAFNRHATLLSTMVRVTSASLLAFVPLLVANILAYGVLWLIPANQAAIAQATLANHDFHYYWEEPLSQQMLLTLFGGYGVAGFCGLMTVLIVLLPTLAIRKPDIFIPGSRIEQIRPGRLRDNIVAFVFGGLGLLSLGLLFVMLFGDSVGFEGVQRWIALNRRYGWHFSILDSYDRSILCWIVGVLLIVDGIGLFIAAFIRGRSAGKLPEDTPADNAAEEPPSLTE